MPSPRAHPSEHPMRETSVQEEGRSVQTAKRSTINASNREEIGQSVVSGSKVTLPPITRSTCKQFLTPRHTRLSAACELVG